MRKLFILILCVQFNFGCISQTNHNFNLFLDKFKVCEYPIIPVDVFLSLEAEMKTKYISKNDFKKYLYRQDDVNWIYDSNYDYTFGGKFYFSSDIICVFYRRDYMPQDIDAQVGEVILCTFNLKGDLLANIPIAGGYGDSITFSSVIHNSKNIEVNYKTYRLNNVEITTKYYEIKKNGEIEIIKVSHK